MVQSYYLYLDTSGKQCEVILFNESGLVAYRHEDTQTNHGRVINRFIAEVLTEGQLGFKDLEAVCVLNGPGSYTGLRISLSTAKGICYAWGIRLFLLHKLSLLRSAVSIMQGMQAVACMLKARENEYFLEITGAQGEMVKEACLLHGEEVQNLLQETGAVLFGEQPELGTDFPAIRVIEVKKEQKISFCLGQIRDENVADLFQSEPFYMKNVHINKINKL